MSKGIEPLGEWQNIVPWANEVLGKAVLPYFEAKPPLQPAVFIVGLPRSGTTLFHQLVVSRLRVGYIDNLIARFWGCPPLGIILSKQLLTEEDRASLPLSSDLGRTTGLSGPHEFGYFWSHWFGLEPEQPHHLSAQRRSTVDIDGLGKALIAMQQAFELPMVFKNLTCGFQGDLIDRAYSPTLFVYVDRDPVEIGRSMLAARQRFHGTYEKWWSLTPAGWPDNIPNGGPAAEVAWQVIEAAHEIKARLSQVESMTVHYEDILADPEQTVMRIADRINAAGVSIAMRGNPLIPLERPTPPTIPAALLKELKNFLNLEN